MDNLFKKLVEKARHETPPEIDVSDSVIKIISQRQNVPVVSSEKPFYWMASISAAAAIAIGTFAVYAYYAWANPLSELSDTIAWVL